MLTLGLIGHGVIGRAVAANAKAAEVLICDPAQPGTLTLDEVIALRPSLFIVAVGTPSKADGSCDTSNLKAVLDALRDIRTPVIVHSTAPPSFYRDRKQDNLVHIPEFVTEQDSVLEYAYQQYMIVGETNPTYGGEAVTRWRAIFRPSMRGRVPNYWHTTIETAAFIKYTTNTMLAMKVTYLNQCAALAKELGVDWGDVTDVCRLDERLGSSHWMVPGPDGQYGYGGMCFPKDVAAFIAEAASLDVDFTLLDTVQQANTKLRGPNAADRPDL